MFAHALSIGILFSASCLCVRATHRVDCLLHSLKIFFCCPEVWYCVNFISCHPQWWWCKSKPSSCSRLLLYNHRLIFLLILSVDSLADTFHSIGLVMRLCQLLSVLEILHILIGIDKSRLLPRFLQVSSFSRLFFRDRHMSAMAALGDKPGWTTLNVAPPPFLRQPGLLIVC